MGAAKFEICRLLSWRPWKSYYSSLESKSSVEAEFLPPLEPLFLKASH